MTMNIIISFFFFFFTKNKLHNILQLQLGYSDITDTILTEMDFKSVQVDFYSAI